MNAIISDGANKLSNALNNVELKCALKYKRKMARLDSLDLNCRDARLSSRLKWFFERTFERIQIMNKSTNEHTFNAWHRFRKCHKMYGEVGKNGARSIYYKEDLNTSIGNYHFFHCKRQCFAHFER